MIATFDWTMGYRVNPLAYPWCAMTQLKQRRGVTLRPAVWFPFTCYELQDGEFDFWFYCPADAGPGGSTRGAPNGVYYRLEVYAADPNSDRPTGSALADVTGYDAATSGWVLATVADLQLTRGSRYVAVLSNSSIDAATNYFWVDQEPAVLTADYSSVTQTLHCIQYSTGGWHGCRYTNRESVEVAADCVWGIRFAVPAPVLLRGVICDQSLETSGGLQVGAFQLWKYVDPTYTKLFEHTISLGWDHKSVISVPEANQLLEPDVTYYAVFKVTGTGTHLHFPYVMNGDHDAVCEACDNAMGGVDWALAGGNVGGGSGPTVSLEYATAPIILVMGGNQAQAAPENEQNTWQGAQR